MVFSFGTDINIVLVLIFSFEEQNELRNINQSACSEASRGGGGGASDLPFERQEKENLL